MINVISIVIIIVVIVISVVTGSVCEEIYALVGIGS